MKREILTILRGGDDYISGQQICEDLKVSRTAVWKTIRALKEEGYEIEAIQNRGYQLLSAPDVLTEAEIGSRRRDRWRDCPLVVFDETDSTNTQAGRLGASGAPEGTLVIADAQHGGKGRRGRSWQTPPGESLAMSFLLRPSFEPSAASMLTLIAAAAGRRAVKRLTGEDAMIKWPNDLVLNRKKICGILTEMELTLESYSISHIVVGMGFNVHQNHFEGELEEKATSLLMETGRHFSRAELACCVMEEFADAYMVFEKTQDLEFLADEYNRYLAGCGQEVCVISPDSSWTGISRGINSRGALLVSSGEGETQEVIGGEVSVRGLYGYI